MAGNYSITVDGKRIGTVQHFVGNPAKKRWVVFTTDGRQESFNTLREAQAWAVEFSENSAAKEQTPISVFSRPL